MEQRKEDQIERDATGKYQDPYFDNAFIEVCLGSDYR